MKTCNLSHDWHFSFPHVSKRYKYAVFNESFLNVQVERSDNISCLEFRQSIQAKDEIKYIHSL